MLPEPVTPQREIESSRPVTGPGPRTTPGPAPTPVTVCAPGTVWTIPNFTGATAADGFCGPDWNNYCPGIGATTNTTGTGCANPYVPPQTDAPEPGTGDNEPGGSGGVGVNYYGVGGCPPEGLCLNRPLIPPGGNGTVAERPGSGVVVDSTRLVRVQRILTTAS